MRYIIYPPIGIARLGNSAEFFVASESATSLGTEIQSDGSETPIISWKDSTFRMKKQAARFHLFEDPEDGSAPVVAQLPAGSTVEWSVKVVNKKDAVIRPDSPPSVPIAITGATGREDRIIDSGMETISGANTQPIPLAGAYRGQPVALGEIRTDSKGRLLVLGGTGTSMSPNNAPVGGDFYNNEDWYDDVGDGPVTAVVKIPGEAPVSAVPAWVLIAPPDFAPGAKGVVTLWDVITQTATASGFLSAPSPVFFDSHVRPMIAHASSLQWVNPSSVWKQVDQNWNDLADPSDSKKPLRQANAARVKSVETVLQQFELQQWQHNVLESWVDGTFQSGFEPSKGAGWELTRSSLDGTVGQGFFPGIEAGIIVTNPSIYSQPFDYRLDHTKVSAGDLTALMALPWQADFLKCSGGWWPAQRPGHAPQAVGPERPWLRPTMNHKQLVANAFRLGVITPSGARQIESGRDPTL